MKIAFTFVLFILNLAHHVLSTSCFLQVKLWVPGMVNSVIILALERWSKEGQKLKKSRPAWSAPHGPVSRSPNERQHAVMCWFGTFISY